MNIKFIEITIINPFKKSIIANLSNCNPKALKAEPALKASKLILITVSPIAVSMFVKRKPDGKIRRGNESKIDAMIAIMILTHQCANNFCIAI